MLPQESGRRISKRISGGRKRVYGSTTSMNDCMGLSTIRTAMW